jgi:hypothetical protein
MEASIVTFWRTLSHASYFIKLPVYHQAHPDTQLIRAPSFAFTSHITLSYRHKEAAAASSPSMDLLSTVRKTGSRGGVNFSWDDVATSQHRENYLGHSLKAPVGRWAQGRDLTWYAKSNAKDTDLNETEDERHARERREEIRKIKEAEEDAIAAALGLPPKNRDTTGANAIEVPERKVPENKDADEMAKAAKFLQRQKDEGNEAGVGKERQHRDPERHRRRHRSRDRERREDQGRRRDRSAERSRREDRGKDTDRRRSRSREDDKYRSERRHRRDLSRDRRHRSRSRDRTTKVERDQDSYRPRDRTRSRDPNRQGHRERRRSRSPA